MSRAKTNLPLHRDVTEESKKTWVFVSIVVLCLMIPVALYTTPSRSAASLKPKVKVGKHMLAKFDAFVPGQGVQTSYSYAATPYSPPVQDTSLSQQTTTFQQPPYQSAYQPAYQAPAYQQPVTQSAVQQTVATINQGTPVTYAAQSFQQEPVTYAAPPQQEPVAYAAAQQQIMSISSPVTPGSVPYSGSTFAGAPVTAGSGVSPEIKMTRVQLHEDRREQKFQQQQTAIESGTHETRIGAQTSTHLDRLNEGVTTSSHADRLNEGISYSSYGDVASNSFAAPVSTGTYLNTGASQITYNQPPLSQEVSNSDLSFLGGVLGSAVTGP